MSSTTDPGAHTHKRLRGLARLHALSTQHRTQVPRRERTGEHTQPAATSGGGRMRQKGPSTWEPGLSAGAPGGGAGEAGGRGKKMHMKNRRTEMPKGKDLKMICAGAAMCLRIKVVKGMQHNRYGISRLPRPQTHLLNSKSPTEVCEADTMPHHCTDNGASKGTKVFFSIKLLI